MVSGPPVLTTPVSDNAKIQIIFDSPTMNDYILSMILLYIILGVMIIPFLFILIESIVERLPEDHRFVLWWRKHVVGITDDDLF